MQINELSNKSLFPTDKTISDMNSQRSEEREWQKELEGEKTPENDEKAKDTEYRPEFQRVSDPYPKTSFSAWLKHLEGLDQCVRDYKVQLAACYIDPVVYPALATTTLSAWLYIRHGLEAEDGSELNKNQKEMDEKIEKIQDYAIKVGDAIQNKRKIEVIEMVPYISEVRGAWVNLFYIKDKLGLTIRLRRTPKWEQVLEMKLRKKRTAIIMASEDDAKSITPQNTKTEPEENKVKKEV